MFLSSTCKLKMPWHHFPAASLGVHSHLAGCLLQLHVEKALSSLEKILHFPYPVWNAGGGYTATVIGQRLGEIPQRAADCGVPAAAGALIFITALRLDNSQCPVRRAGEAWGGAAHFPVAGWQEKVGTVSSSWIFRVLPVNRTVLWQQGINHHLKAL